MSCGVKVHKCSDACKGRASNSIKCFLCNENVYTKCFAIDKSWITKSNSSETYMKFICGSCQTNSNRKHKSTSSVSIDKTDNTSNDMNLCNRNMEILIKLLSMQAPGTPPSTSAPNPPSSTSTKDQSVSNVTADNIQKLDNIYSLILKSSDKLNTLHTVEAEKNNMSIILTGFEHKTKELCDLIS